MMIRTEPPLRNKVIFVDWHGVLSRDPFWMSILNHPSHPLHGQLSEATRKLFSQNDSLVRNWMRGNVQASEVIESMQIDLANQFQPDYLNRKLVDDCLLMRVNTHLQKILQEAKSEVFIVLATDNMDCFFEQMQRTRNNHISFQQDYATPENIHPTFASTVNLFDDTLCSSELGVLKRENPRRFFSDWLDERSLDFQNALLIDDLEVNCSFFRSVGGTAYSISYESDTRELDSFGSNLQSWMQTKS